MRIPLILLFALLIFVVVSIPIFAVYNGTIYVLDTPPTFNVGEEWSYNVTVYNKTSGETEHLELYINVDNVNQNYYILSSRLIDPYTNTMVRSREIIIDKDIRTHNITITFSEGSKIELVYTGDQLPYFAVYPSSVGESLSITAYVDIYFEGTYYYTDKEVYSIETLRKDNIVLAGHVIPAYVVSTYCEIKDPDTDYTYSWYNETVWINKDFKLPFLGIYEDSETRIIYKLIDYTLSPDPINNYPPTTPSEVSIEISYSTTGNYTTGIPDTSITIKKQDGTLVGSYRINELPKTITLEEGIYSFTIENNEGYTTDNNGVYRFLYWRINGINYEDTSVTLEITDDTNIELVFQVDRVQQTTTPPAPGQVKLTITYSVSGNYTSGVPNASIKVEQNGVTKATYTIQQLPATINLDPGRYTLKLEPSEGTTVDGEGTYSLIRWVINGNEFTTDTVEVDITSNTTVKIEFNVNKAGTGGNTGTTTTPTNQPPPTTQQQYQPSGGGGSAPGLPSQQLYTTTPSQGSGGFPLVPVLAIGGVAAAGIAGFLIMKKMKKPPTTPPPPQIYRPPQPVQAQQLQIQQPPPAPTPVAPKAYKICPYCGARIPAKAKYCPKCGREQPPLTQPTQPSPPIQQTGYIICPYCGARIPAKAKFCPKCGAKLK